MPKMSEFYRIRGVEVARMQACGGASFPRHTHAEYVVSANLSGSEDIWVDGKNCHATGETVTLYNPEAMQASTFTRQAEKTEFISLYIAPETIVETGGANGWLSRPQAPELDQGVFANTALYRAVWNVYAAARDGSDTDTETGLIELSALLLANRNDITGYAEKPPNVERLAPVLEFMKANLDAQTNLDTLSKVANVSKFHLIRAFKFVTGTTPARYHMQLRLIEARDRLRRGQDVLRVAHDLGFYDQSHFINAFRKVMGISPLRFAEPLRSIG